MNQYRCALLSVIGILFSLNAPTVFAQSGQISLTVDATLAGEHTRQTGGPLTLYYPKWIPGEHGPDGPIGNLTGLKFTANGKTIPWQRDLLDNFTFHIDVPAGEDHLDVAFDYLEPGSGGFATSAASATDRQAVFSIPTVLTNHPFSQQQRFVEAAKGGNKPQGWHPWLE
jgi:hypothetical protein